MSAVDGDILVAEPLDPPVASGNDREPSASVVTRSRSGLASARNGWNEADTRVVTEASLIELRNFLRGGGRPSQARPNRAFFLGGGSSRPSGGVAMTPARAC
jgi:hypothetical protein